MPDETREYNEQPAESGEDGRKESAIRRVGAYALEKAEAAVNDKVWIEDRWIEDTIQLIGDNDTGEHTHNITKEKTLTAEARISDLLFQVGDKNFTITPDGDVPVDMEDRILEASLRLEERVVHLLDESKYETHGRAAIKQACALGVGVVKGPVKVAHIQKSWLQTEGEGGKPVNSLTMEVQDATGVEYVSVWDYFPDLSVAEHKDCAFEFQRHHMSKSDLQKLLLRKDFNHEEILGIIRDEETSQPPRYLVELRSENLPEAQGTRHVVYEGYLSIPSDMIKDLCQQEPDRQGNFFEEGDTDDIVFDIETLIWVSESGRVIKLAPVPLETEERPFSVFCYDRDMSCFMASSGVPRLVKNPQADVNKSWERINRNAGLSIGPQWICDPEIVEPFEIEGEMSWDMTPNKGWSIKKPGADLRRAFHFFNVPSGVQENMLVLQQSLQFADVETQLPQIASGEQSKAMTRTFQGMELLLNASNTTQRRIIKDWDDYVTIPLIGRMIDDVMQNSPLLGVLGAFIPNAQGVSGLLLRETMAKNALNLTKIAESNPAFRELADWPSMFRQVVRGLQADPDVVIKSKQEQKEDRDKPRPPSAEMIDSQARMESAKVEKLKVESQLKTDQLRQEVLMAEVALKREKMKIDYEVAMAKLEMERRKLDRLGKGKVVEVAQKSEAKREEIKLQARAKESNMAQEFQIEATGKSRI